MFFLSSPFCMHREGLLHAVFSGGVQNEFQAPEICAESGVLVAAVEKIHPFE